MFTLTPSDLMHDIPQGTLKWLGTVFLDAVFTFFRSESIAEEEAPRKGYFLMTVLPNLNHLLHSYQRYYFPTGELHCSDAIGFSQAEMPNSNRVSLAVFMLLLLLSPDGAEFIGDKPFRVAIVRALYNQLEQYFVYKYRALPTVFLTSSRPGCGSALAKEYLQVLTTEPLSSWRQLRTITSRRSRPPTEASSK